MAVAASKYLDLRALSALAHLRFSTRKMIDGSYSGRHRSRQQGGAGEVVDFREYAPGEDLRRLDWKVLGRTGRSYVKLYQDETNLLCTACIDSSGSMGFSGFNNKPSKLDFVQRFTAALAYMIAGQQDQVGLAVIGRGLESCLDPGSTTQHLETLYSTIDALAAKGESNLAQGLHDLFSRSLRRGVLLLMSDFLVDDLDRVFAAVRLFRHRHWEVAILHIVHPEEERLPEGRAYRFEGLEGEGTTDCSPADVQTLYRERFEAHGAMVRSLALAAGCEYRRVSTGQSYLTTLGAFLVERTG